MDADEKEICDFLRSFPGQFVSGREICGRAGGQWGVEGETKWGLAFYPRMFEKGYLESDASAHFRLITEKKDDKKKRWLSPEMKKLLEGGAAGAGPDGVTEIEDPDDSNRM